MAVSTEQREAILRDVHQSWSDLIDVLNGFSDEELQQPNVIGVWSLKDLVGHLEVWDRIAIEKIDRKERNERSPRRSMSLDEFNRSEADRKRSRSISELWDETMATHEELVRRLEETPVLSRDLIYDDTYGHYREHLRDIRAWQSQQ